METKVKSSEFRVPRESLVLQAMAIVDHKGKRSVRLLGPTPSRDLTPDEADALVRASCTTRRRKPGQGNRQPRPS